MNTGTNTKLDIPEVPELAVNDQQASNNLCSNNSEEKKHIQKKRRYSQIGILILFIIIIATTVGIVVHYTKQDTGTLLADSKDSEQQVATDYPETVEPSISTSDNAGTQAPTNVISASTTKPSERTTFTEEGTFPPLTYESGMPTVWGQVGEDVYGPNPNIYFGHSVSASFSGTIIIVGAPGAGIAQVYQFDFSAQAWHRLGQTLGGTLQDDTDDFGYAVSMSDDGKVLGISAPNHNEGTGKVYLYALDPLTNEWMIAQELEGESRGDGFGASISLCGDGSTVAIGALQKVIDMAGYVKVHKRDNETIDKKNSWLQVGDALEGEESGDRFGSSVALSNDGRTIIVGAPFGGENGQAYVFHHNRSSGKWNKFGRNGKLLSLLNLKRYDRRKHDFGRSVMISSDGKIVAVTSPGNEQNNGKGITKVFKLHEKTNTWKKLGNDIVGHGTADYPGEFFQGTSLSNSGTIIAIGSWGHHEVLSSRFDETGGVHIYEYLSDRDRWEIISQDIFGKEHEDKFGWSTSLSGNGNTIVVGGPENDVNGFNSGHVQVYHRANCSCVPVLVSIVIRLDNNPSETGWSMDCGSRGTVHRVDPGYYEGRRSEEVVRHLSALKGDDCTITIEDTGNNGIRDGYLEVYYGTDTKNASTRLAIIDGNGFTIKDQRKFLVQLTHHDWKQVGQSSLGEIQYGRLGFSLSMSSSGNIIVAGAPNSRHDRHKDPLPCHAQVFTLNSSGWNKLGQSLQSGEKRDAFGFDVSVSNDGTIAAISAPWVNNNTGSVYIYTIDESKSEALLMHELSGEGENYYFGSSLSLSGDGTTIAISSIREQIESIIRTSEYSKYEQFNHTGYVKVFQYDHKRNNEWRQIGDTISNSFPDRVKFGENVALSDNGSVLIVGAPTDHFRYYNTRYYYYNDSEAYAEIYHYDKSTNKWTGYGDNNIFKQGTHTVTAISKDGDVVAIFDNAEGMKVTVYHYDSIKNMWKKLGDPIFGAAPFGTNHGLSLSDSGQVLAIGDPFYDPPRYNKGQGAARVFKYVPNKNEWIPSSQVIGTGSRTVSLSGNGSMVAIGDPYYGESRNRSAGRVVVFSEELHID